MRQATALRRLLRCLRYGSRTKKNLVRESLKMQLRPVEAFHWMEGQMGIAKAGIRILDGAKV